MDPVAERDGFVALEIEEGAETTVKATIKLEDTEQQVLISTPNKHAKSVRYSHLKLHIFTSIVVSLQLILNLTYLTLKIRLYIRRFNKVLESPWLLIVLFCECGYFICSLFSSLDLFLPQVERPKAEMKEDQRYPTIDIFVPCCGEPTEIPYDSILAALALKYPSEVFRVVVLDDGDDDELKAVCEQLQAKRYGEQLVYLRRQKVPGVPHNFKCGNLNFGLEHSTAEFVVMMDADMILQRTFLQELIPYIVNSPEVAFVQIPQSFYNLPPGDPLSDACVLGYERILMGRDGYHGTACCVGTGVIFRRQSLDEIGGFQSQSISEDTMTSFVLFNYGYKSVYLDEKLQIGLTPWTFEGYIKQRQRWGQGAIQQFAASWKTMLGPKSKLNLVQKCLYFWHTGFYFMFIFNIILVTTTLCILTYRLNLVVGTEPENRLVFALLAAVLIMWRLAWISLCLSVSQSIQTRNREESHFWWMTPFFFSMLIQTLFNYKSTFKFVSTSSVDQAASAGKRGRIRGSALFKQLEQLKHLKAHIAFVVATVGVIVWRVRDAVVHYGLKDCDYTFTVVGVSLFLVITAAHMALPVMHILWPTGYKPDQRKSLLMYDSHGVPHFTKEGCEPKFSWSVLFYESLTYLFLAYWIGVLYVYFSGADTRWCAPSLDHSGTIH